MSLKYGTSEIAAMATALDPEYLDLAKAAKANKAIIQTADQEFSEGFIGPLRREVAEAMFLGEVEDFAAEALAVAETIFEKRAKFVVVGQLAASRELGDIKPIEPAAIKVSLGWYSTEGDAIKAAESLWSNAATGDQFRCWVLPVHHGSPADLHAKRKEQYQAAEEKRKEAASQRMREQIAKRAEEAQIRADGGKGSCQCGHQQYDHSMVGTSRGKCWATDCSCPRWDEKKK